MNAFCAKFKYHFLLVMGQTGIAFAYFITNSAFHHGLRPEVYATYRLFIGAIALLPFAYFKESTQPSKLTAGLLCRISALAFLGTCVPIICFYEGLRCTAPTVAAAVNNTIPSIVFVLAVLMNGRMESMKIGTRHGMAKVAGSVLSLTGVTVMTIFKGQSLSKFKGAPLQMHEQAVHDHATWIRGSALVAFSCLSYSVSYILQEKTLNKYPTQLSLAVWMNLIGGALAAVFAGAITWHEPGAWVLGFNIRLISVIYGGLTGSGFLICVQLLCTKKKGAVFITMFNPLTTILSAFISYFLVGAKLYIGSILGAAIVVVGLYCLLWGKHGDQRDMAATSEVQLDAIVAVEHQEHVVATSSKIQQDMEKASELPAEEV